MTHKESKIQQQCVAWFRAQYPQYAMLLTHPANEGNGNRVTGAIHKAEGTVAGVPDLLLFMPACDRAPVTPTFGIETLYKGLGIEIKTRTGRQSQSQKDFQKMFESAGYKYIIVRTFDDFRTALTEYIGCVDPYVRRVIASAHVEITQAAEQREKEKFYKVIGKR